MNLYFIPTGVKISLDLVLVPISRYQQVLKFCWYLYLYQNPANYMFSNFTWTCTCTKIPFSNLTWTYTCTCICTKLLLYSELYTKQAIYYTFFWFFSKTDGKRGGRGGWNLWQFLTFLTFYNFVKKISKQIENGEDETEVEGIEDWFVQQETKVRKDILRVSNRYHV